MLIDGALVRASTGSVFETVNPATEEVLGVAADASDEDAERALGAARRAFDDTTWSTDVTCGCGACVSSRRRCASTPRSCGP